MCVMNELAVTRSGESQFMKDVSSRADLFAKMWLQQTRGARGVYRVRMRAGSHYSVRYDWSRAHSYTHPGRVSSRRTCRFTVRGAPVSFKVCSADQCWVNWPASSRQPCFVLRARAQTW